MKTGLDSVQGAFLSFEKVVRLGKFELCFDSCIEISGSYSRLPWTPFRIKEFSIPDTFDSKLPLKYGVIEGLRQTCVDKLINAGAKTICDLKEMFEAGQVHYKAVAQFFKYRNPDLIKNIRKINQFVACLKFPDNKETK